MASSSTHHFSSPHSFSTQSHQTNSSIPFFFLKPSKIPNFTKPSISTPFPSLKLTNLPLTSKGIFTSTPKKTSMAKASSDKGSLGSFEVFDSEETVAISLAKYTSELSHKFVHSGGYFTVVVSGGSLIKSLRKLAEAPYVDSIDWSKWHVFWVDERVVPKDHPDSNYKLAYDGFLSKVPILPENIHAINDTLPTKEAAEDYEDRLRLLVNNNILATSEATGFPKFDAMLLGMGPDGHVASLFPGHPLVKEDKKWVTHITDSPKPPPERITFTFPVINSSAYIALVVCGAGKAGIVKMALGGGENQSSEVLPVQMVSPEGELKWFLDKDAASLF